MATARFGLQKGLFAKSFEDAIQSPGIARLLGKKLFVLAKESPDANPPQFVATIVSALKGGKEVTDRKDLRVRVRGKSGEEEEVAISSVEGARHRWTNSNLFIDVHDVIGARMVYIGEAETSEVIMGPSADIHSFLVDTGGSSFRKVPAMHVTRREDGCLVANLTEAGAVTPRETERTESVQGSSPGGVAVDLTEDAEMTLARKFWNTHQQLRDQLHSQLEDFLAQVWGRGVVL